MPQSSCPVCARGVPDGLLICPQCARPAAIRPSGPARLEREQQERVARLVSRYVKLHPALAPLREAGERVVVWHHPGALWLNAVRNHVGNDYELEARVSHPAWWEPVLDTEEDWAARLTTRLAKGLRKQWDEWHSRGQERRENE